jgi:hypothetical protein
VIDLENLELNSEAVMRRLAGRVGQLELELAIARETIETLGRQLAGEGTTEETDDAPKRGSVRGSGGDSGRG